MKIDCSVAIRGVIVSRHRTV